MKAKHKKIIDYIEFITIFDVLNKDDIKTDDDLKRIAKDHLMWFSNWALEAKQRCDKFLMENDLFN